MQKLVFPQLNLFPVRSFQESELYLTAYFISRDRRDIITRYLHSQSILTSESSKHTYSSLLKQALYIFTCSLCTTTRVIYVLTVRYSHATLTSVLIYLYQYIAQSKIPSSYVLLLRDSTMRPSSSSKSIHACLYQYLVHSSHSSSCFSLLIDPANRPSHISLPSL